MIKRKIFYSFHYQNDLFRVQQIRNIGSLEGNTPVTSNEWEQVKKGGDASIKLWIDSNLKNKSCLIVLIGSETAHRKWVKYEIEKAWNDGRGVVGIYIHNINCMRTGKCYQGLNPLDYAFSQYGNKISLLTKTYNPNPLNAYQDIKNNLERWIDLAVKSR